MPVAQGPEGWGALSISAPFCYTLIKAPPLFTELPTSRVLGNLASGVLSSQNLPTLLFLAT
jgi:hypothetical protein